MTPTQRRRRGRANALILAAILLATVLLALAIVTPARADDGDDPGSRYRPSTRSDRQWIIDTVIDRAEAHDVDPAWMLRVVVCETRNDPFKPDARGDGGLSEGIAQLHRDGLRPLFYRLGYTDPDDPEQAADFMARAFQMGLAYHWSCK